jgi:hypothetical protein
LPPETCDLVADIAHLTGWQEATIYAMPLHRALYYQLKAATNARTLCEWFL